MGNNKIDQNGAVGYVGLSNSPTDDEQWEPKTVFIVIDL
jgi:hypothetical protein